MCNTDTGTPAHRYIFTFTHVYLYGHAYVHTCTHLYAYPQQMHNYTHMHTNMQSHTHINTYTCAHIECSYRNMVPNFTLMHATCTGRNIHTCMHKNILRRMLASGSAYEAPPTLATCLRPGGSFQNLTAEGSLWGDEIKFSSIVSPKLWGNKPVTRCYNSRSTQARMMHRQLRAPSFQAIKINALFEN